MSQRIALRLTMELKSDAVFGTGFSIPGGEDVAVCVDEKGYPYLKGSTLKGLLRESLENYLEWSMGDQSIASELCGAMDWAGQTASRRIQITSLLLDDKPLLPDDCFSLRTFTSLEDGTVKKGTLRTVSCIRQGLRFSGELHCDAADEALVKNALSATK